MKKIHEENENTLKAAEIIGNFTEESILKALEELDKMQEQIIKTKKYLNVAIQKIMEQKVNRKTENTNTLRPHDTDLEL